MKSKIQRHKDLITQDANRAIKVRKALAPFDLEDFNYYIARYTGPENVILCENMFGMRLYADDFTNEIIERSLLGPLVKE